ncbi:AbiJ-related protein [Streptomyces litmocidini]|uniref:AbiJ-related protein n=1 Tax=Streptomyces litmocidini TaxID=67318 RepID=UPI0036FABBD5
MAQALTDLGMPPVEEGSKRERVERSLAQTPDGWLLHVAERFLQTQRPDAPTRNLLEDTVWALASPPEIPLRARRELARAIDPDYLIQHGARFMALLDRFWHLDDVWSLAPSTRSLRARVERHFLRNTDWTTEELFEQLGAFEAGDARFTRFAEAVVAGDVLLDEMVQRRLVGTMNEHLRTAAIELRETGTADGYLRFTLVPIQLVHAREPKNIIFATPSKPDIRFLSAVDNDIEVVNGDVLIYDRTVTDDGIRWRDLQSWWQDRQHLTDAGEAKNTLYARLLNSLPASSPGQRNLFDSYHRILGAEVYDMPALLPEVWLHWDPRTVRERGPQALLRFRMDFLLLLPHGQRVVLEVDGSQHYTRDHGHVPDTAKYAAMVAADRDLRLSGYEVYRFGHDELRDETAARTLLEAFLPRLFQHHRVTSKH